MAPVGLRSGEGCLGWGVGGHGSLLPPSGSLCRKASLTRAHRAPSVWISSPEWLPSPWPSLWGCPQHFLFLSWSGFPSWAFPCLSLRVGLVLSGELGLCKATFLPPAGQTTFSVSLSRNPSWGLSLPISFHTGLEGPLAAKLAEESIGPLLWASLLLVPLEL